MKKNFSLKFMAMAMAAAVLAAPGCKDYDDDISGLRTQVSELKTALASQKTALEASIADVKTTAEAAKTAAAAAQKRADDAHTALAEAVAAWGLKVDAINTKISALETKHDADVKKLQENINKVETEANAKIEAVKADVKAKYDELAAQIKTLDEKVQAELLALNEKAKKAAEDIVVLQGRADAMEAKAAMLEEALNKLTERVTDLENTRATKEELAQAKAELQKEIDAVMAAVEKFVGNRLTSITLIPTAHTNGIAAADLLGVAYKAQSHAVNHLPYTFATLDGNEGVLLPSRGEMKFRLSPRSIAADSYANPFIESWTSINRLRNVSDEFTGKNTPIKPISHKYENDMLKVTVVKTIDGTINQSSDWLGNNAYDPFCQTYTDSDKTERFYMASLGLEITEKYRTDVEKAEGSIPVVTSEGFRVSEIYKAPVIKSRIAKDADFGYVYYSSGALVNQASNGASHHNKCYSEYRPYAYDDTPSDRHFVALPGGRINIGLPTHFSDSTLLYQSRINEFVDKDLEWNVKYDLMQFVDAATRDSHATFDWRSHGLEFRFAVATAPYLQGPVNQTNQQEFATIENGTILTNKVYTVGGQSATAVGREPIIRVQLVDTKNNKVVDQRYMKFRWVQTAKIENIGKSVFDPLYVNCVGDVLRIDTKRMNEEIYRQIEKLVPGITKAVFTDRYRTMHIVSLKKDNTYILKQGEKPTDAPIAAADYSTMTWSTDAETAGSHAYKNLRLFFIPEDQEDIDIINNNPGNTSFNVVWTLNPEVVRTVNGKSTFLLEFLFLDRLNERHLRHFMEVEVRVPEQEFNYEETYWTSSKMGQEFRINPIVYAPGNNGAPRKSEQADYDNEAVIVHGPEGTMFIGDSHIQADLVNGFLYQGAKPDNLGEFIQYIRRCARVAFEFDQDRFGEFEHLKDFKVGADGTTLWYKTVGAPNNKDFIQTDKNYAASILNFLSVTAATNVDAETTRPWDIYNEDIINNNPNGARDEARAIFRLHEDAASVQTGVAHLGTDAAIMLVGKVVPVKIMVEYNQWNKVAVKKYDVFIIEPLTVKPADLGNLVDAKIGGAFTGNLLEKYTYTDWNFRKVANTSGEPKLLYKYYAVKNVTFDVENAKTNIKTVNGNNIVTEGYTQGSLPYGRILEQVANVNTSATPYWTYTVVNTNPTHLRYANEHGTPVNVDYKIFIDVVSTYKWGKVMSNQTVIVKAAEGTNP